MNVVGLDIGGANLKGADRRGRTVHRPFALWRSPERLADELRIVLASFGDCEQVAVTMTGELCDCFETKSAGVRHIVQSVRSATDRPVQVFTTANGGSWRDAAAIERDPLPAAASNWLALATFVGRRLTPSVDALLVDLGSTTCDLIPIVAGRPCPRGWTDTERMKSGELVYCGVRRTPVCAVLGLRVAAEFFATMEDVYVTLGELTESPDRRDTADGRPATRPHAAARLARMLCDEGWSSQRAAEFAREARDIQTSLLAKTIQRVVPSASALIVSAGEGEFLVEDLIASTASGVQPQRKVLSLAAELPAGVSAAACAYAAAMLAEDVR